MNNTVENDFFGFLKVKWLHLTGKVYVSYYTQWRRKQFKSGGSRRKN